jgi:hypothetical protein
MDARNKSGQDGGKRPVLVYEAIKTKGLREDPLHK